MRKKIGIFTVGGSTEPVINSIKTENFDFIYFICSEGSQENASERLVDGLPLKKDEKIIARVLNLPQERYTKIRIRVEDVDEINTIYEILEKELLPDLERRFRDEEIEVIANYTGGTKSMSVALCLFAIYQNNWSLQLNTGVRTNVLKIDSGDYPVYINKVNLNYRLDKKFFDELLRKYLYEVVRQKIHIYIREPSILRDIRNELLKLDRVLNVFILWDRFNHEEALNCLEEFLKSVEKESPLKEALTKYLIMLKEIVGLKKSHGFDKVIDLILNARRREVQERYDDAIARYYRAVEMIAQIVLKRDFRIDPSNIDCNRLDDLPEGGKSFLNGLCEKFRDERGRLRIGLKDSFDLLYFLDHKVGVFYNSEKKYLLNALESRNFSILAHGEKPMTREKYDETKKIFENFILGALNAIDVRVDERYLQERQMPNSLSSLGFA